MLDFQGRPLSECAGEEVVVTTSLPARELLHHRAHFPAMLDADAFEMR